MGSESIDLSLSNLYKCWRLFRQGKIASREIIKFEYFLEINLRRLQVDLNDGNYKHGDYRQFEVTDNKRRLIKVAPARDRVVHRLIYEYLKPIFDKMFIYDAWSCRENKGLVGAVKRSQEFLRRCPTSYVWRSDIKKFFDSVSKEILFKLIQRKVGDNQAIGIIKAIIFSEQAQYERESKNARGIPIGNLTSQIFANIYLNELDRFVKHNLKIKYYLRYGDDFIIISENSGRLDQIREKIIKFLQQKLRLEINDKNDIIIKARRGLKFLGMEIFSWGRKLNQRNWNRARTKLAHQNISSYSGLVKQHSQEERIKEFNWTVLDKLNQGN